MQFRFANFSGFGPFCETKPFSALPLSFLRVVSSAAARTSRDEE
jgi:hypothetical protein